MYIDSCSLCFNLEFPLNKLRVLVLDDEPEIVDVIVSCLEAAGMQAEGHSSSVAALTGLKDFKPDIVLLDRLLPGISGIEVVREVRALSDSTPILMITAVDTEHEIVSAFETGVDDYLTKPFSSRELVARVKAITRRSLGSKRETPESLTYGELHIHLKTHEVTLSRRPLSLTLTEFKLLKELVVEPDVVRSRDYLRQRVLESDHGSDRTIDVHMASLRRKLGSLATSICTVRGVGYRLKAI